MLLRSVIPALALPLFLAACRLDGEAAFARDYVDDYESDLVEAAAEEAEMALLDPIEDTDDAPPPDGQFRAQAVPRRYGPLSILQDDPHFHDARGDAYLDEAQALGADAVRVFVFWRDVVPGDPRCSDPAAPCERPATVAVLDQAGALQTTPFDSTNPDHYVAADGQSRWLPYDAIVDRARARGLKVLLTLSAPLPYWGSEDPAACQRAAAAGAWSCGYRPDAREYARFVAAAGKHFKDKGIWAWTLWNEPNITAFLDESGSGDARTYRLGMRYRKLWFTAYKALRRTAGVDISADRREGHILFGDLANDDDPIDAGRWKLFRYALCLDPGDGALLEGTRLYRCPERARRVYTSGVAFHPYGIQVAKPGPGFTRASIDKLDELLQGAQTMGRLRLRTAGGIYITEFGYLTQVGAAGVDGAKPVSLAEQAAYLRQTEQFLYDNPRVRSVAQYTLFDDSRGIDPADPKKRNGFNCGLRFGSPVAPADGNYPRHLDYLRQVATLLGHPAPESPEGQAFARSKLETPKPAYDAYRAPMLFSVSRVSPDAVKATGFLRSATSGTMTLLFEGKFGATWVPLRPLRTDAHGYGTATFSTIVADQRPSAFRLKDYTTMLTSEERLAP